jgi:hypothetical protein
MRLTCPELAGIGATPPYAHSPTLTEAQQSLFARRHPFVRAFAAVAIAAVVGGCAPRESGTLPIPVTADAQAVLDGWQSAGITCDTPTAGMPGPALQWSCAKTYGRVELSILLTSDSRGLESIVADASDGTDRAEAGEAWARLVEATQGMNEFAVEAAHQLRARGAEVGWYEIRWSGTTGHISIVEDPGCLCLFIVPDDGRFEAQLSRPRDIFPTLTDS